MILFFLTSIISVSLAQVVSPGQCKNPSVVKDFNLEKYVGMWHEIYGTGMSYEDGLDCISATYAAAPPGSNYTVSITNRGVVDNKLVEMKGQATHVGLGAEAKFEVVFPSINDKEPSPYWVIETDYEGYAIVYSCTYDMEMDNKTEYAWVLTRDTYLPPLDIDKIYPAVSRILRWSNFRGVSFERETCQVNSAVNNSITLFMMTISIIVSKLLSINK